MVFRRTFFMLIQALFKNGSRESFKIFYIIYSSFYNKFILVFIKASHIFNNVRHRFKIMANKFYATHKINPLVVKKIAVQKVI